jgi:hypothetical protein
MYVRFTIPSDPDRPDRRTATGIFHATGTLKDADRFNPWQAELLQEDFEWFNANLPRPTDLHGGRAVCWFRPEARAAISRAWRMAKLVESIGIPVQVFRRRDPGLIVYRDDFQVAAVRWRGSSAR